MNLQSLHILNTKWKFGGAVTVASEQKLKKQGSVSRKRKFVVVSCLLSKSKYQFRFRFGLRICEQFQLIRFEIAVQFQGVTTCILATSNFTVSVDFTTNMLSELVLDRFGKQEGLYKSISLSFVLLEITERKILMSATENATVLKLSLF